MKKLVAAGVAIVVVGGGLTAWALTHGRQAPAAKATTATVVRGDLTVTASASGSIVAVDKRALTFGTSGMVATVSVKAGDRVTAGQVLATLNQTDAENAVTAARTALSAANDNLTLAESQATQAPATSAPTPAASGQGGGAGPGGGAGSGTGGGTGSQSGRSTSTTGTDNLLRAQQTVNNDELALQQAQARLNGTTITAPSAGRVLSVAGAVGDSVTAGGSGFIVLSGTNDFAVSAEFSEADVAAVKVGQHATVTLANHPGTKYAATVTRIDPAGITSGSLVRYGVELGFDSVPPDLLLGQSADVAVTTASANGVLYVPAAAVTPGIGGQSTVLIRTAAGDLRYAVTTGLQGDQGVEIKSGLTAGLTVVIR